MRYETKKLLKAYEDYGKIIIGIDFDDTIYSLSQDEYIIDRIEVIQRLITELGNKAVLCLYSTDSGNPVDIICGTVSKDDASKPWNLKAGGDEKILERIPEQIGVVELLWDLFGGTVNGQGYRVLDLHIGAIYGDSITIDRAEEICKRLEAKGFASTNIVLGIGSFTYQYNIRDTFVFAMKATYVEIDSKGRKIFKDPITDDGTKKSAKGLLCVGNKEDGILTLIDQTSWKTESKGELQTIFIDGKFENITTLSEIRKRLTYGIKEK